MVKGLLHAWLGLSLLGLGAGCKPDISGAPSVIDAPRVLAIKSEPAEAAPKTAGVVEVTWSALYVGPHGEEDPSVLDWALCTERKALETDGELSPACLVPAGDALVDLGNGAAVMGALPDDGCRNFGPNPPLPKAGEPAPRPTDPDSTGGYYQPLRVAEAESDGYEYAVGLTRISCGLARVSAEQSTDFNNRYRPNENPVLTTVVVNPGAREAPLSDDADSTASVSAGSTVTLRASWPDCPLEPACGDGICGASEDKTNCPDDCKDPHGCTGSEPYVSFDLGTRQWVERREGMRVSWYAAGGSFEHDRTGQTEAEAATTSTDNSWTAPNGPGDVHLWAVLRDDRGGIDWGAFVVRVQ
jgi:hypothetical protein